MKVNPLNSAANFIQRKIETKKAAEKAVDSLLDLYGNKIDSFEVFTNKKGVVSALGYSGGDLYTHAYSILPDGTHIQKVISREKKSNSTVNNYMTLIKDAFNHYSFKNRTVKHTITASVPQEAEFTLNRKMSTLIDAADMFGKK